MITPLVLLTRELNDHKRALKKSRRSFFMRQIDWKTHRTHWVNLTPLIKEYKAAIKKLKS
jgi:hypothetical protein